MHRVDDEAEDAKQRTGDHGYRAQPDRTSGETSCCTQQEQRQHAEHDDQRRV